jgi:hypothetical protein
MPPNMKKGAAVPSCTAKNHAVVPSGNGMPYTVCPVVGLKFVSKSPELPRATVDAEVALGGVYVSAHVGLSIKSTIAPPAGAYWARPYSRVPGALFKRMLEKPVTLPNGGGGGGGFGAGGFGAGGFGAGGFGAGGFGAGGIKCECEWPCECPCECDATCTECECAVLTPGPDGCFLGFKAKSMGAGVPTAASPDGVLF